MNSTLAAARTPLSQRLKAATSRTHERLDQRIMAARPFDDPARYARFLRVQYLLHRDVEALYHAPGLPMTLPDLAERSKLDRIAQDLADLADAVPPTDEPPAFHSGAPVGAGALGWLYVVEGSSLGAAFLYKAAAGLSLNENYGARHLSGHPDGRARHWRAFTAALDAAALSAAEEDEALAGAVAAFARVHALVDQHLG